MLEGGEKHQDSKAHLPYIDEVITEKFSKKVKKHYEDDSGEKWGNYEQNYAQQQADYQSFPEIGLRTYE